jgi:hypothetical protein
MESVVTFQSPARVFHHVVLFAQIDLHFLRVGCFHPKITRLSGKICGYLALRMLVAAGDPKTVYFGNDATSTGLKRNWENMYKPFFQTLKSWTPGST